MKSSDSKIIISVLLLWCFLVTSALGQFETKATPVESISVKEGFEVELLFTVPKERLGSWVNLCLDNKNRIIASDQFGGLYRFEVPAEGKTLKESDIEKIPVDIRAANGLLWAFGSLYVAVNDYEKKMESGVYRLTDSNGDDQLDKVEKLQGMQARGEGQAVRKCGPPGRIGTSCGSCAKRAGSGGVRSQLGYAGVMK